MGHSFFQRDSYRTNLVSASALNDSQKWNQDLFREKPKSTSSIEAIEIRSPNDGAVLGKVESCSKDEAHLALEALYQHFHNLEFSSSLVFSNAQKLKRVAERLGEEKELFAQRIASECGKPIRDARVEVDRAILTIQYSAEEALRLGGREVPMRASPASHQHMAWTTHEPLGVVLAISAFNHPLNLMAHQVAPALAVGCPILFKPALETPLTCFEFLKILHECGFTDTQINIVYCSNVVAESLVQSTRIRFFSFIGSSRVGWHLRSLLAPGVRFALEHGGTASAFLEPSVDLTKVGPSLVKSAFYHAGQVCVSLQNLWVHRSILKETCAVLVDLVAKLKVGSALNEDSDLGPLIRKSDQKRIHEWVEEAKTMGAQCLSSAHHGDCAGEMANELAREVAREISRGVNREIGEEDIRNSSESQIYSGNFYPPTLLLNPPVHARIRQLEVFGPVLSVMVYDDLHEAIREHNQSSWSLHASIFTQDLAAVNFAIRRLKATAVLVNEVPTFRVDWMPFYGDEQSGFSKGGVPFTMRDYLKEKLVVIKNAEF